MSRRVYSPLPLAARATLLKETSFQIVGFLLGKSTGRRGAGEGTRTPNLQFTKLELYQLSYANELPPGPGKPVEVQRAFDRRFEPNCFTAKHAEKSQASATFRASDEPRSSLRHSDIRRKALPGVEAAGHPEPPKATPHLAPYGFLIQKILRGVSAGTLLRSGCVVAPVLSAVKHIPYRST